MFEDSKYVTIDTSKIIKNLFKKHKANLEKVLSLLSEFEAAEHIEKVAIIFEIYETLRFDNITDLNVLLSVPNLYFKNSPKIAEWEGEEGEYNRLDLAERKRSYYEFIKKVKEMNFYFKENEFIEFKKVIEDRLLYVET